jgi:serine/threonine protein kinase
MDTLRVNLTRRWFIDSHEENIKDKYKFTTRLGTGSFGVVYLGIKRNTGKAYAPLYPFR